MRVRQISTAICSDLHNYLMDEYQGRLNAGVLWGDLDAPIRVDNQYGDIKRRFCKISVTVANTNPGGFQLKLTNTPMTEDLRDLIEGYGGEVLNEDGTITAMIDTSIKRVTLIRELAKQYRRTVGRGARYPEPNWKWICPRTGNSLHLLSTNITEFRKFRRAG